MAGKAKTVRRTEELVALGWLTPEKAAAARVASQRLPIAISPHLGALIDEEMAGEARGAMPQALSQPIPDLISNPVARQFVPDPDELSVREGEGPDPIGDEAHSPVKGIVHRYPDRVLLKPVHLCPVYCRFCFRRDVVGTSAQGLSPAEIQAALGYIRAHREIWEVIFSGGDPLILSNRRLGALLAQVDAIEHVEVLRLHTRFPIADPARIDDALVAALKRRATTYMVLHCNHVRELTPAALAACVRLIDAGIPVLSQTVLLRGVNDSVEALSALMRQLVRARIKPYYLHHLDQAAGTGHFRTTVAEGQALMRALRGRLSGLCQPQYVLDIPGGHGKVPIGPNYVHEEPDGSHVVEDFRGVAHVYRTDAGPKADPKADPDADPKADDGADDGADAVGY